MAASSASFQGSVFAATVAIAADSDPGRSVCMWIAPRTGAMEAGSKSALRRNVGGPVIPHNRISWRCEATISSPPGSNFNNSAIPRSSSLNLNTIRDVLFRQEDTIIFNLIERAQYCYNGAAYDPSRFSVPGFDGSLVQYLLRETESLHAKVRRYTSPDEHPFFKEGLPEPTIAPFTLPERLLHAAADSININEDVWAMYFDDLLPKLTVAGDDGNYGSTSTLDVLCLQALSKRIHYGKFVAEAKYVNDPERFNASIRNQDSEKILELVTFGDVEAGVLKRVEAKAKMYGQSVDGQGYPKERVYKISPLLVARLYEDWVMPLTKKVQVQYLLRRLD